MSKREGKKEFLIVLSIKLQSKKKKSISSRGEKLYERLND